MKNLANLAIALTLAIGLFACHSKGRLVGDLKDIDGTGGSSECVPPVREFSCPEGAKFFSSLADEIDYYEMNTLANADMEELATMSFGGSPQLFTAIRSTLSPNLTEPAIETVVCKSLEGARLALIDPEAGKVNILDLCEEFAMAFEGEFLVTYPDRKLLCDPSQHQNCTKEIFIVDRDGFKIAGTEKFISAEAGTDCLFREQLERMDEYPTAIRVSAIGAGDLTRDIDVAAEMLIPNKPKLDSMSVHLSKDEYLIKHWLDLANGDPIYESMAKGNPSIVKEVVGSRPGSFNEGDKDFTQPNGVSVNIKFGSTNSALAFFIQPPFEEGSANNKLFVISSAVASPETRVKIDVDAIHKEVDVCEILRLNEDEAGGIFKLKEGTVTYDISAVSADIIRLLEPENLKEILKHLTGSYDHDC